MTADETRSLSSEPNTSPAWWFLGTLAEVRNPSGAPRTPAVIELTIPLGGSPPEHVHRFVDDSFYVLAGEVVVRCGESTFVAKAGTYASLPAGVPHTFRVMSDTPARLLIVHADDDFLGLIEEVGTPTDVHQLPSDDGPRPDAQRLIDANSRHGATVIGAPLEEDEAQAVTEGKLI